MVVGFLERYFLRMENKINVKIINSSRNPLPAYATAGAAGMDVRADIDGPIVIEPMSRCLIPTGLYVAVPQGYELQMRPRSGLALKSGISLVNTPGTIDSDYRGEIGVIIINLSDVPFTVNPGDRICQMVLARVPQVQWEVVSELPDTERADGGFGHTGV